MLRRYGPAFGPGDTVGCGLDYADVDGNGNTRISVFFVLNGEFLGYAFRGVPEEQVRNGLYPTVGVDTECPLFVNFGERPFRFDFRGYSAGRSGKWVGKSGSGTAVRKALQPLMSKK